MKTAGSKRGHGVRVKESLVHEEVVSKTDPVKVRNAAAWIGRAGCMNRPWHENCFPFNCPNERVSYSDPFCIRADR